MNNKYWKKYYKNKKRQKPSPFFDFCKDKITFDDTVLDFGAGDGRDTYAIFRITEAIAYIEPNNKLPFLGFENIEAIDETDINLDIIYARWVIHAVSEKTENKIIDLAVKNKATLMLEFRVIGDKPDKTHKRRLIEPYNFQEKLKKKGFIIKEIKIGYGFSKVGDNDPKLCRIIAEYQSS